MCGCLSAAERSRFSGWLSSRLFASFDSWADEWYRNVKIDLFRGIAGRVVEIGPGTGVNFGYYAPGTRVVAVEPNRFMHDRLKQRARESGIRLRILGSGAEAMTLPDGYADHVVGTLVLCSVRKPALVLMEVERVLKPGGQYHFVEHVRSEGVTGLGQSALHWPWRLVFDGCRLNRDTEAAIRAARMGWTFVSRCELGPRYLPIRSHVLGRVHVT